MSFFSKLTSFVEKIPGLGKEPRHSLTFLNIAQFFGVINDNLFKLLLVFMLIDRSGHAEASNITSLAGAIFVIPFLLFSSTAGVLADRFSKQRLLIGMKAVEAVLMGLALVAFGMKNSWASYTLLFLLATHSAIFGPSKYGIIPEIVKSEKVPKANGLITGFTYFAIILGTFLASFLTDITDRNFVLSVSACLLFAIIGFVSAFEIKKTAPQGSKKKFNLLFIREIYFTLSFSRTIPHLLSAIFGSSFFLFVGGFTQLNIIPYAIQSLHLREIDGGYLFLAVAFGIALGAFLAGKLCKHKIELGLPCLGGFAISLLLALLSIFSHILSVCICCLFLLGVFGGMFIVPCDSFLQVAPPHEKRGQVIGANNFLSFAGVLLASFALFFFSNVLKMSSAQGFAVMGFLTLVTSFILSFRLSDFSFPLFFRIFLSRKYKITIINEALVDQDHLPILILRDYSWRKIMLLLCTLPRMHFIMPKSKANFFYKLLGSISFVDETDEMASIVEKIETNIKFKQIPCILFDRGVILKLRDARPLLTKLIPFVSVPYVDIDIESPLSWHFYIRLSQES